MRVYSFLPSMLLIGLLIFIASPNHSTTADFENESDEAQTTSSYVDIYAPTVEGYPLGTPPGVAYPVGNPAYQADCLCVYTENGNYITYTTDPGQNGTYTYFDSGGTAQQATGSYSGFIKVRCDGEGP